MRAELPVKAEGVPILIMKTPLSHTTRRRRQGGLWQGGKKKTIRELA